MKFRATRLKSILFFLLFAMFALSLYIFLFFKSRVLKTEVSLKSETVNGKILLKSFQAESKKLYNDEVRSVVQIKTKPSVFGRLPATLGEVPIKKSKIEQNRQVSLPSSIIINNQSYRILKDLRAVKSTKSAAELGMPKGYITVKYENANVISKFDSTSLLIVTDKYGINRKIMTGAIVVEFFDYSKADELALKYSVDIAYKAPQINTVIYQLLDGQNIFEIQKKLSKLEGVKSVKLELLGKGAVAQ